MKIFALKNIKVPYWNPPTFAQGDKDDIKTGLYRYCILNPQEARKAHYDECELYYLGDFDDQRGKMKLLDDPEFLLDLREAFRDE